MQKMYRELADWWPLLSQPEDYAEEAAFFAQAFRDAGVAEGGTLLELGCGGGNNALYLKQMFGQVTLTDLSPDMLAVSRALNPECEHALGDMRTLRLGRTFDAVFVHDAIMYMTTEESLRQALETAFVHCRSGGVAMFVPDYVRETFVPSTSHGGHDGQGRALRYLDWTFDPDESDTIVTTEYVYLLRDVGQPGGPGEGMMRVEHETHQCGLFPRGTWLGLLEAVGFTVQVLRDGYGRDVFVCRRAN